MRKDTNKVAFSDRPPKTEEVLATIAQKWLGGKYIYRANDRIPRDPFDLARWWMKNQSPPKEPYDRPTQHNQRDGSGTFWSTPYSERLRHTLISFLSLDKDFQSLIIAAAEDRIFWRGDERRFFISVIAENDRMRKIGIEAYRDEAMQKSKEFQARAT